MGEYAPPDQRLERLVTGLEADFRGLIQFRIARGWRVSVPATDMCGVCYALGSPGKVVAGKSAPVRLGPGFVAIVPSGRPLWLEGPAGTGVRTLSLPQTAVAHLPSEAPGSPIVAGVSDVATDVVYIPFHASWGTLRNLFGSMHAPMSSEFTEGDPIRLTLAAVVEEFGEARFGSRAVLNSLLKQVIILLLRRSLEPSADEPSAEWSRRLAVLGDLSVNRALANMAAWPGRPHSVTTLSQVAGLSRSAFMARFVAAVGSPPFVVLRELRMKRAAELLDSSPMTIDQVARAVGYSSRSSFARAYRVVRGVDPSSRANHGEEPLSGGQTEREPALSASVGLASRPARRPPSDAASAARPDAARGVLVCFDDRR